MSIDYAGPEGGRLAAAFAAGCTATYVFIRNLVMKPAIKSCHQRINELTEDRDRLLRRVDTLETILLTHGSGEIRSAIQAAISELRIEVRGAAA